FPDQVAAVLAVIAADRAFASIMRKAAELGALVEGADGVGAKRAKTHGGNVEQREVVGLPAFAVAHANVENVAVARMRGNRMVDPLKGVAIDVLLRAERPLVELALGALIGDGALGAVEGHAVGIAFEEVLADFRPHLFQPEADVGEDRIIAP